MRIWVNLALFSPLLFLCSCASGTYLKLQQAQDILPEKDVRLYNVILYGGETPQDVETIAVLDRADDAFIFNPAAPDFSYRLKTGLNAVDAFLVSDEFITGLTICEKTEIKAILAPDGTIAGYEVRPLFTSQVGSDYLSTRYVLKDEKTIKVYVKWLEYYKPFSGQGR